MKVSKSLFFLSKKDASSCYNKVFHVFCLKDFVKMIWKIILGNSVPLTEGVIMQLFVISAIMTMQSSHSWLYCHYSTVRPIVGNVQGPVGKFNRISDEPLPKRKKDALP